MVHVTVLHLLSSCPLVLRVYSGTEQVIQQVPSLALSSLLPCQRSWERSGTSHMFDPCICLWTLRHTVQPSHSWRKLSCHSNKSQEDYLDKTTGTSTSFSMQLSNTAYSVASLQPEPQTLPRGLGHQRHRGWVGFQGKILHLITHTQKHFSNKNCLICYKLIQLFWAFCHCSAKK